MIALSCLTFSPLTAAHPVGCSGISYFGERQQVIHCLLVLHFSVENVLYPLLDQSTARYLVK